MNNLRRLSIAFFTMLFVSTSLFAGDVTVKVLKGDGTNYQNVSIQYHQGYWKSGGTTDINGETVFNIPDGTYSIKATVGGTSKVLSGIVVSGSTNVNFQSSTVTAHASRSDNSDFAGVAMHYHAGYWRSMGNTDANGDASAEIFDGSYNFKASIEGTQEVKNQVISGNSTVNFQTSLATFEAQTSLGAPLSGVAMHYHAGYWRSVGTTDGSGTTTHEMFSGTYNAKASIGGTSATQSLTVNSPGSVTFYTTKVTVKAEDCDNSNPISGVDMHYHSGYWRSIGTTGASGESMKELFPGNYNFKASIGGTNNTQNHAVPGDSKTPGMSTTVSFSPTRVELTYAGTVQYHSGYWRTVSNPDYLFPGTYNFRFDGTVIPVTISGCSLTDVIWVICVKDSDGNPMAGIPIAHNDYGNHYKSVGSTDANGILLVNSVAAGTEKFRASKNHTSQMVTSAPGKINFQTAGYTVHVKDESGADFPGIAVAFNDYGNHYLSMGNTDANGKASIELFAGNRKFRGTKNHTSQLEYLNLANPGDQGTVVMQTARYFVHVKKSDGTDHPGVKVAFNDYGNHYLSMGNTDASGKASIELFAGNRKFRGTKNHTSQIEYLNLANPGGQGTVVMQTALAVAHVENCDGDPIEGVKIGFNDYGNHYLSMGNTDLSGDASIELFSGNRKFRATNHHTSATQTIALALTSTTATFVPTKVCFSYPGTVKFNDYGNHYKTIGCPTYLFPGTYKFSFGGEVETMSISGCEAAGTIAIISLINSNGDGISGQEGFYRDGSYVSAGLTDNDGKIVAVLPSGTNNTYFRMKYLGHKQTKKQNVGVNPNVVFQTVKVDVVQRNSADAPLNADELYYRNGSGSYVSLGTNISDASIEMLPLSYYFRSKYLGHKQTKKQNVGNNSTVKFQTVPVTVKLDDSNNNPLAADELFYRNGTGAYVSLGTNTASESIEMLPLSYYFRAKYLGHKQTKKQNVGNNATVEFQTVPVTVKLDDSNNNLLAADELFYRNGTGAYVSLGTNTASESIEMLPLSYYFRAKYLGHKQTKKQNVGNNATVEFQTVPVTVKLDDSNNNPLAADELFYRNGTGAYVSLGTNTASESIEMLPLSYYFRAEYLGHKQTKKQNVGNNATVEFQTVLVTMNLIDGGNSPLTADHFYYRNGSGTYVNNASSVSSTTLEMLPLSYYFRAQYSGDTKTKKQNVGNNANVEFGWDAGNFYKSSEAASTATVEAVTISTYPNPFTSFVNVSFTLAQAENVEVYVHDIQGKLISVLYNGQANEGEHTLSWDASAMSAKKGIYLITVKRNGGETTYQRVLFK